MTLLRYSYYRHSLTFGPRQPVTILCRSVYKAVRILQYRASIFMSYGVVIAAAAAVILLLVVVSVVVEL
jgi:hypothetical protein